MIKNKTVTLSCSNFTITYQQKPKANFTRKQRVKLHKLHLKRYCRTKGLSIPIFSCFGSEENKEVITKQSVEHLNFINTLWQHNLYALWLYGSNNSLEVNK